MPFTHSDAEKAYDDGSFKLLPDEDLRQMQLECRHASGANTQAVSRIREVGEKFGEELEKRRKHRQEQERSGVISAAPDDLLGIPLNSGTADQQNEWDEARLATLLQDGIEESSELEYKAAGALKRENRSTMEITKDVSSFANSAGGTIIYGIMEFQDESKNHLPERVDPVSRSAFSKEWLEHIVAQIRPRIIDVKIHPVSLSSNSDHVAYVVGIPQGTTAHQATDCRYYRRYNFEAVRMLDHEIKDVMNRKTQPRLSLRIKFVEYPRPNSDGDFGALVIKITNDSDVLARYVGVAIDAPIRFNRRLISYQERILDTGPDGATYRLNFSNHDGAPLFPRATLTVLFPFHYVARMQPEPESQAIDFRYTAFADSMPKQQGTFTYSQVCWKHGDPDPP